MVMCEIVSVLQKKPLIGAYLTPYTMNHLTDLEEELNRFPGSYPIVMGDLNADASWLKNPRNK